MSTTTQQAQQHLEARARDAARSAAGIARARLRQQQRESATEYGRALFARHGEAVALRLEDTLGRVIRGELEAGPFHAGIWLLLPLGSKGPRAMAAIALGTVLDRVSQRTTHRAMALAIGRAIEEEVRALPIEDRGQDLLRVARRRHGRGLVTPERLAELRIEAPEWSVNDRFQVGEFCNPSKLFSNFF